MSVHSHGRAGYCPACGHPGTDADPLVPVTEIPDYPPRTTDLPIHQSHTKDPRSGFYGRRAD